MQETLTLKYADKDTWRHNNTIRLQWRDGYNVSVWHNFYVIAWCGENISYQNQRWPS